MGLPCGLHRESFPSGESAGDEINTPLPIGNKSGQKAASTAGGFRGGHLTASEPCRGYTDGLGGGGGWTREQSSPAQLKIQHCLSSPPRKRHAPGWLQRPGRLRARPFQTTYAHPWLGRTLRRVPGAPRGQCRRQGNRRLRTPAAFASPPSSAEQSRQHPQRCLRGGSLLPRSQEPQRGWGQGGGSWPSRPPIGRWGA